MNWIKFNKKSLKLYLKILLNYNEFIIPNYFRILMINEIVDNLVRIKQNFAKNYDGNAHIQEVIPLNSSKEFPIEEQNLKQLHTFAQKNPIYLNSFEKNILDIPCMVYEGDINDYWLNSIKHGSSCQPFYPTWIMSAYVMSLVAKKLGYLELVDIGSGDGRIAYCGKILDFNSHSIEIDDVLVNLQNTICSQTNQNFNPKCEDALEFEYSKLEVLLKWVEIFWQLVLSKKLILLVI